MRRSGPGRVRHKLAEMLSERLGIEVAPGDIWEQTGAYRTNKMHDALVWGVGVTIGSWSTMGECVKNGFDVTYASLRTDTASGCRIQIDARECRRQPSINPVCGIT